jgi:hypothetical protein
MACTIRHRSLAGTARGWNANAPCVAMAVLFSASGSTPSTLACTLIPGVSAAAAAGAAASPPAPLQAPRRRAAGHPPPDAPRRPLGAAGGARGRRTDAAMAQQQAPDGICPEEAYVGLNALLASARTFVDGDAEKLRRGGPRV